MIASALYFLRRNSFWNAFFFLLPILSNLKIFPNTVFDLFLGILAIMVLAKSIRRDLLFWVMVWMSVVYFRGLFLEPIFSNSFLSCLRYLVVAGIVIFLNGKLSLNPRTAFFYVQGTLVIAAQFAIAAWTGYRFGWDYMWMQKWLFCGPSFLTFTLMAGFLMSLLIYKDHPKLYLSMLACMLFLSPVLESRLLDYYSLVVIGSSFIPLGEFFTKKKTLFVIGIAVIYGSLFEQTILLKKIGLFPFSIEKIQINPLLKAKNRLDHDSFYSSYDQDRKIQIKKAFKIQKNAKILFGEGGMQHQKIRLQEAQNQQVSIKRPVGILVQRHDGGVFLMAGTAALILFSIWRALSISWKSGLYWQSFNVAVFLVFAAALIFITNPTGSIQWWLFIAPHGFLQNLLSQAAAFKTTPAKNA